MSRPQPLRNTKSEKVKAFLLGPTSTFCTDASVCSEKEAGSVRCFRTKLSHRLLEDWARERRYSPFVQRCCSALGTSAVPTYESIPWKLSSTQALSLRTARAKDRVKEDLDVWKHQDVSACI